MDELKELENIIQNINESLQPISNEINDNLNFLTHFLNEENTYKFDKITMDEIAEDK